MKVELKASVFPLLYAEHHACIMLPHVKIYPSDLPQLQHTHLNSLATPTTVHHHLRFEEDEKSSPDNNTPLARTEHHLPAEHPMAHHLSSTDIEEEEEEEEDFPTAPLNDDIWMEEPVPYRHLYIHKDSQHDLCLYPCPITHHNIWTSATFLISKIWQQPPVMKILLTSKMFSNFNIDSSLNRLVTHKDGIMNTNRNCATLLINCEIKKH